jgi:hypothetical protein
MPHLFQPPGVVFQLISVSAECFNDRFQWYFHNARGCMSHRKFRAYHITATSTANPQKRAVATVTVLAYCGLPGALVGP